MKKTTRRDFIKISAAGTAGLAFAGPILEWVPPFLKQDYVPLSEDKAEKTSEDIYEYVERIK